MSSYSGTVTKFAKRIDEAELTLDTTMVGTKISDSKARFIRMVLSTMLALIAAEYAGTIVGSVLADFGDGAHKLNFLGSLLIGAYAGIYFVPFTLLMTWKVVLILVVIGELAGRPHYFYPVAGVIAAHCMDYSVVDTARGDWFLMTVVGGVAGSVFIYMRRLYDFS